MEVYLDVIWLLNVLFDSLLLYLTALFLKRNIKMWRIFAGGLVGSVIILLSVTPINTYSGHPLIKLLFSIFMILMTFGYKRFRYFMKGLTTFYLTTFLIGGTLIGVHYFINYDSQLASSVFLASINGFGDPISWIFVLLGFPIAWHFSKRKMEDLEMTKIQYDSLIKVMVTINGRSYTFNGLVDSGNQLYDPITKMPVMFISIKKMEEDFPEALIKVSRSPDKFILGEDQIDSEWEHKMKVIPYKVVGQEHQLIIAVKPEKIILEKENEFYKVEKGLVSFTMQQLSSDNTFQCIVHPKMLTTIKKVNSDIFIKNA